MDSKKTWLPSRHGFVVTFGPVLLSPQNPVRALRRTGGGAGWAAGAGGVLPVRGVPEGLRQRRARHRQRLARPQGELFGISVCV